MTEFELGEIRGMFDKIDKRFDKFEDKLDTVENVSVSLSTILKGNGSKGICQRVDEVENGHRKVVLILAGLAGSGTLGGGIFGLVKLLS